MKKWMILILICLTSAILATACTAAPQAAAPEATPEMTPEAGAGQEETVATDTTELLGVTAIVSNTDGVVVIKAVKTTYVPMLPGEDEVESYDLEEGDTVELTLKKDAVIDFPMSDDLVKTVTITGEEFDAEYRDFVAALGSENPILFTYEMEGDQVSAMQYFYLP